MKEWAMIGSFVAATLVLYFGIIWIMFFKNKK